MVSEETPDGAFRITLKTKEHEGSECGLCARARMRCVAPAGGTQTAQSVTGAEASSAVRSEPGCAFGTQQPPADELP